MIQCLACEVRSYRASEVIIAEPVNSSQDWFHESCCNLRERPNSRESTPVPPEDAPPTVEQEIADDAASETSSSGLPPPLITGDEYESFVCAGCVFRNATLKRWAGTPGAIMVVRDSPAHSWRRLDGPLEAESIEIDNPQVVTISGIKRPLSPSSLEEPEAKRAKGSSSVASSCLAPPQDPLARKILTDPANGSSLGAGDVFFTAGFRERWCRCNSVRPNLLPSMSCG